MHPFFLTSNKQFEKKLKNPKKRNQVDPVQALICGRPATSGRLPAVGRRLHRVDLPFFLNFFFVLPSIFSASGQLLLVGSSTCPPYPEFT
jgi:hypothetical protein